MRCPECNTYHDTAVPRRDVLICTCGLILRTIRAEGGVTLLAPIEMRVGDAILRSALFAERVAAEVARARAKHPPIHSAHEGYAVLLEELDELKGEVWKQTKSRDREAMLAELVQLAAMAQRVAEDLGLIAR